MENLLLEKLANKGEWDQVFKVLGVNPNGVFEMDEIEASNKNSKWAGFDWLYEHFDTMRKLEIVHRSIIICDWILFIVFIFYLFSFLYKLLRYKFFDRERI
uniref:Uncharacterized protein n=1 Tax=Glossina morsitans morsitans TaxID=37546 RepID=A0A1B0FA75_GLOMM